VPALLALDRRPGLEIEVVDGEHVSEHDFYAVQARRLVRLRGSFFSGGGATYPNAADCVAGGLFVQLHGFERDDGSWDADASLYRLRGDRFVAFRAWHEHLRRAPDDIAPRRLPARFRPRTSAFGSCRGIRTDERALPPPGGG
jgi:hypothetical protein